MRTRALPRLSDNRGVPGSSPGLAITGSSWKRLTSCCVAATRHERLRATEARKVPNEVPIVGCGACSDASHWSLSRRPADAQPAILACPARTLASGAFPSREAAVRTTTEIPPQAAVALGQSSAYRAAPAAGGARRGSVKDLHKSPQDLDKRMPRSRVWAKDERGSRAVDPKSTQSAEIATATNTAPPSRRSQSRLATPR